jgi:hypothetical protein
MLGHAEITVALLNLAGFAAILGVATVVAWFKRAPWAGPPPAPRETPVERPSRVASRLREAS